MGLNWPTGVYDEPFSSPIGLQWPSGKKCSNSAPGNGQPPSPAILDVIRPAAVGTAITPVLISACPFRPQFPPAPWFLPLASTSRSVYSRDLIRHRSSRLDQNSDLYIRTDSAFSWWPGLRGHKPPRPPQRHPHTDLNKHLRTWTHSSALHMCTHQKNKIQYNC